MVYICGCFREGFTDGYVPLDSNGRPIVPLITVEDVVPLRRELEGLFTEAGEALCPSFNMVKEEIVKANKGTVAEKETAAVAQMRKEAGGKIYDCRSYPDHLQVPADIGAIVTASAVYLDKKLGGLLERVDAALSCKPLPIVEGEGDEQEGFYGGDAGAIPKGEHYRNVTEYYADVPAESLESTICTPAQMKTRAAIEAEKAAAAAAASCKAPTEISYAQQKQLLEIRIKSLSKALKDAEWVPRITRVKATLRRFQEIKAKIDAGTLMPNCGPNF